MSGLLATGGLIGGILTIIVGLVLIIWPRLLAYIIGIYFIIIGTFAVIVSVVR